MDMKMVKSVNRCRYMNNDVEHAVRNGDIYRGRTYKIIEV